MENHRLPSTCQIFCDVPPGRPEIKKMTMTEPLPATEQDFSPSGASGNEAKDQQQPGAERLVIVSDCGIGHEGMSRHHARYKIASLVQGTNIV
jgi:hypothetical protein